VSPKKLTREFFRRKGREGGLKSAQRMTPAQRRASGVKGMAARWGQQTDVDLQRLGAVLPLARDVAPGSDAGDHEPCTTESE
jgi:hypothetical protein